MSSLKVCKGCLETLPAASFHRSSNTKDGLRGKCKACVNQANKDWYEDNKESVVKRTQAYKAERRDFVRQAGRDYYQRNKAKYFANDAKRANLKRRATPPWLSPSHLKEIEQLYWLAVDLYAVSGEKYHVDHIVPIQGKNVCGLHVPWNLQILPSDLNIAKSNRW